MFVGYTDKDTTMIRKHNTHIIPLDRNWFIMNSRPKRLGVDKDLTSVVAVHTSRRTHDNIIDNFDAGLFTPSLLETTEGITIMFKYG
jgi:hypothetical protein